MTLWYFVKYGWTNLSNQIRTRIEVQKGKSDFGFGSRTLKKEICESKISQAGNPVFDSRQSFRLALQKQRTHVNKTAAPTYDKQTLVVCLDSRWIGSRNRKCYAGSPDFSWHNIPKWGKYTNIYNLITKC
jgi:hypothetical protein